MILVFKTLQQAVDCEAQISSIGAQLYEANGYDVVDGEVVIKEGKQRIERWSAVNSAQDGSDNFWISSPSERYPEYFEQLVSGFNFEEMPAPLVEWVSVLDGA